MKLAGEIYEAFSNGGVGDHVGKVQEEFGIFKIQIELVRNVLGPITLSKVLLLSES